MNAADQECAPMADVSIPRVVIDVTVTQGIKLVKMANLVMVCFKNSMSWHIVLDLT